MMLEHGGFVEPLDECAAVIAGRHNAVVFELNQRLLNRNAAHPEPQCDFIAVDAVAGAQLPRQQEVKDVRNNQVFFFDPVFLWHSFLSLFSNPVRPSSARSFSRVGSYFPVFDG
ncbi:hypothetical protein A5702_24715 [Mycobacterium sp. E3339]|nr:hypothetical protein A5702_24715 [Mycobacterium sp. E3339]